MAARGERHGIFRFFCLVTFVFFVVVVLEDFAILLCSHVTVTVGATGALANMAVAFACFVTRRRCLEYLHAAPYP